MMTATGRSPIPALSNSTAIFCAVSTESRSIVRLVSDRPPRLELQIFIHRVHRQTLRRHEHALDAELREFLHAERLVGGDPFGGHLPVDVLGRPRRPPEKRI